MASKFQNKIIKQYEDSGHLVIKLHKTNKNGIPDILCIKEGISTFIECKEQNDTLKPLQNFIIDELRVAGCEAFCLQDKKGKIY